MKALQVYAGPKAREHLRERGLTAADVRVIPAAAGGPKGLALLPLDRFIFGHWLKDSTHTVHLLGASIGAWRMAAACLPDADAALEALTNGDSTQSITVVGRGLGAYIALQIAGARAAQVHGAILVDGPGLAGGPTGPTSQSFFSLPTSAATPDPYALVELGRDLRPPDYATQFVRLALAGSDLDEPIAVASVFRPEWLDAVAREHGVMQSTLAEALAAYAD